MTKTVALSASDRADLAGVNGDAARWALGLVVACAEAMDAETLVDIERAHLVGAFYSGPADTAVLDRLIAAGGRVRVTSTLNASSADLCAKGFDADEAAKARGAVERLCALGCSPTLTCAPYFVAAPPKRGERLAWAESNAVLYANTAFGARTLKCPQYLDLACALSGRAPLAGLMTDAGRAAEVVVDARRLSSAWFDDASGFEVFGFCLGASAGSRTPFVFGLPASPSLLDLRSLCAAAGASGGFGLVHIDGVTPEAGEARARAEAQGRFAEPAIIIDDAALHATAETLGARDSAEIEAVALGAPHLGVDDLERVRAALCDRRPILPLILSVPRDLRHDEAAARTISALTALGVSIVYDTCTYYGPSLGGFTTVATNSAKWAAYAPGNIGATPVFGGLDDCVEAAATGTFRRGSGRRYG